VRDFQFDLKTGKVSSIIIASLGLPQIPDQVISTYELSMEEVVSSGPNRLIVFEGAEERLTQLTVGVLERLGIGRPPWEKEEEESYYPPAVRPENQLGTGIPVRTPIQVRQPQPVEERWDEDVWEQPRSAPPRRQMESIRYEEEYEAELEADNWGETRREEKRSAPPEREYDYDYEYDEVESDVWDDAMGAEPYNPPPINIPEKRKEKMPEYNED
jgi:hypothetical protein